MQTSASNWIKHAAALNGPGFRAFQQGLAEFNHQRLEASLPSPGWKDLLAGEAKIAVAEGEFLESVRQAIAPLARNIPADADEFIGWYENLQHAEPGQGDPLFPWLAHNA